MTEPLEVFPVAIGAYRHHDDLDVDAEVWKLTDVLREFGGQLVEWDTPMIERDLAATTGRINEWANSAAGNTVLYWIGHGWSNHEHATLAHALSPVPVELEGVTPDLLAYRINRREATSAHVDSWMIVVVDTCKSARFVEKLSEALDRQRGPRRLLLVGVSGLGSTALGQFSVALRRTLCDTFAAEKQVGLWQLGGELKRRLPEHSAVVPKNIANLVMCRQVPLPAGATLDVAPKIQAALAQLTPDEQRHFIPKAQGGELGEISWYFEGRAAERGAVAAWLREQSAGMLVITGRAGSGKSALLGNLLVHSRPDLRRALSDYGLIDEIPAAERPADNIFSSAIHLTGLTSMDLCRRLSADLSIDTVDADAPLTAQIEHLLRGVHARAQHTTILVDALDEAVDPIIMSQAVLRPLAALPATRIVIGTRRSTREGPDAEDPVHHDILEALDVTPDQTLPVSRDPGSIASYVRKRLSAAQRPDTPIDAITTASWAIGNSGREFLFARLAVHELLARPDLLGPQGLGDLASLILGDHRGLFRRAVERLSERRPANGYLLQALAYARGRGAPMHDGVWSALAEALAGDAGDSALRISNDDASSLRDDAAPYLTVDVEHGQTIYRLAHRTFAEHFTVEHDTQADDGQQATDRRRHVAITHKLIDAVEHGLNPYLVTYVSAHAAAGGEEAWQALADRPGALDHLDPRAVTADAMRSAFGRFPLPAHIAGTISAAQQLAAALPADRPGRRQLAAFRYAASDVPPAATDPHRTWSVPWAVLARETTRLTLTGHDGAIHTMTTFPGSEGNIVLATGGHDGTVRLWDPAAGTAVGEPLAGHIGAVRAVTSFAVDNDRHLLASGGQDRIVRLWDPAAGIQVGELVGHTGFIRAMATFVDENGTTLLVTGGLDRAIRIWDPVAGSAVGDPLVSDVGDVCALATFVSAGRTLLAVAGGFGDVRIWDPVTGTRVGEKLRSFVDGKQTLVVHEGENTEPFLATANQDGRIRLWDWRQIRVIDCLGTPYCSIFPLTVFTDDRGRPLLTGGEGADTVVFWDPARERIVGEPLTGHMGAVRSATAFAGRHGQPLLATGSRDGAVRIWAPTTEPRRSAPDSVSSNSYLYAASSPGPVDAIVAIPDADGRVLLAARRGVSVKVFDPAEPARIRHDDRGHGTRTIAGYTSASGAPVLASGDDGGLKLHDLSADSILGSHWVREKDRDYNRISAMTIFTNHDGRPLIGCGLSNGEILAWDPVRDERIYRFIAHSGRVETLTTLTFDDGEVGLVSGGGGSLWIWEASTGNALWNATYARLGVRSAVALRSPERRLLLVAVDGGSTLHMCDVAAKRQVAPPDDLKDGISAIARVPCADGGSLLATATADRMVRLWDLDTMTVVQRVGLGARALALTALDSHRVAVGLADGLAVIELGPS